MATLVDKSELDKFIGHECEPSPWHTVTQEQISQFADCTLDQQFIHVDPEKAKQTPFGTTIAHGFLTLSMLSHFGQSSNLIIDGMQMGINSGFDKVRFLTPVKVGSEIRGVSRIVSVDEVKPGQFRFKSHMTVEIKGETKPALVAEWITRQVVG